MLHIIPNAFFGAFAEGEVLPVLLLAVLCGFGLTRIGAAAKPVLDGIDGFSHMLFAAFGIIMRLAPIGAFGAMAFTVGRYGIKSIGSLGLLIGTFYMACVFFVVVVLGVLARLHGFKLWQLLRYIREELLVVLGTSSSEPVLPRLLMKLERLGCKKGVVGLVLPTGYSFNLDGTAIYLTLASMFIAQACDIHLSWGQIAAMLGIMLLTSKGAAGVTGSGFVALVATLTVMPELPVAGVALIVGIDRFMSEARALTSTISNAVACIVVSKWENACDHEVLTRELSTNYANTEHELGGRRCATADGRRHRHGSLMPSAGIGAAARLLAGLPRFAFISRKNRRAAVPPATASGPCAGSARSCGVIDAARPAARSPAADGRRPGIAIDGTAATPSPASTSPSIVVTCWVS